jgi:hypothetical protein
LQRCLLPSVTGRRCCHPQSKNVTIGYRGAAPPPRRHIDGAAASRAYDGAERDCFDVRTGSWWTLQFSHIGAGPVSAFSGTQFWQLDLDLLRHQHFFDRRCYVRTDLPRACCSQYQTNAGLKPAANELLWLYGQVILYISTGADRLTIHGDHYAIIRRYLDPNRGPSTLQKFKDIPGQNRCLQDCTSAHYCILCSNHFKSIRLYGREHLLAR